MSAVEVRDSGDLRKYRTEIPNMVFELGLSPHALVLYLHFKRTAGDSGKCWKSTRRLANDTGIGAGTVSRARKELESHDLITVQHPENNNKSITVTIADIWLQNFQHFADTATRSTRERPVPHGNTTRSTGERRKEPLEEGTIEEVPVGAETSSAEAIQDKKKPDPISNLFGYYCALVDFMNLDVSDEDRTKVAGNFTQLIQKHEPDRETRIRLVSKMLEARTNGYSLSPQKAHEKCLYGNVRQIRPGEAEPKRQAGRSRRVI